jgi:hypothetical protein
MGGKVDLRVVAASRLELDKAIRQDARRAISQLSEEEDDAP